MEMFWKVCGVILLAAILCVTIRNEKDLSLMLTIAAVSIAALTAVQYLEPVLNMLRELEALSQLPSGMMGILLQCVGITLSAELISMLCTDAGNTTLSKAAHLVGSAAILYLSIPIFDSILTLIQEILG